ncbi:hypothetical protein [Emticicia sp. BO119]|uniref:hypothetical protein n=1 Tax=Emticicia sp. BO119 TaxID=2757768 RepID=UPI0015F07817|nr:hypothetical protein [Emticicia sp. BO119]MBA4849009.1 hypothetical protein [Emticicia sp. BO119]
MKIFDNLKNRISGKLEQSAENLVGQVIDKGAEKAADLIGQSFSNPIPNPIQIPEGAKQDYMNQVLGSSPNSVSSVQSMPQQPPPPVQQQIPFQEYSQPQPYPFTQEQYPYGYPPQMNPYPVYPQMGYQPNPYSYPMPQVQLTMDTPVPKLEASRVEKMATYETWFFFKVMKVAKDTIRFVAIKYFSWRIDEDIQVIQQYEQSLDADLEKAYKKAKYNLQKLEEIKTIKDDKGQDDPIFKEFVYDAILDNLMKKNELGQLKIPSIWEIGLREIGFFTYEVFSPNKSIEMFFESIQSDIGKAILNNGQTNSTV